MNQVSLKLPAYVIADVHLSGRDPATQKLLFRWLDSESFNARSLIILGDLFDAWIGDDAIDPVAQSFANHLQKIIHRGVDVFFVAGNRDFLLGDEYARKAGMKRLDEPLVVDNIEPPTALIHGDVLCTDDKPYQRFRTRSRDPIWQAKILRLPILVRRLLARWARFRSRSSNSLNGLVDVNHQTVQVFMREHNITRLIHGHTHRPALHRLEPSGHTRWVLGDWEGGRGYVIKLQDDGATLCSIEINHEDAIAWTALEPASGH